MNEKDYCYVFGCSSDPKCPHTFETVMTEILSKLELYNSYGY